MQSDAYQATGCYNMLCSGFIQINSEVAMGASIFPLSGYSGNQYDISILIWKVREHVNLVVLEIVLCHKHAGRKIFAHLVLCSLLLHLD